MLRISTISDSENHTRLRVEGRLMGPWVEELRQQCQQALCEGKTVILDLGKLLFVDSTGAALLRELAERQVVHENGSMFIRYLLRETENER